MEIIETIKSASATLGSIGGTLITLTTLAGILFKPLRKAIMKWIRSASSADDNCMMINEVKTLVEKNNKQLMEMIQEMQSDLEIIKKLSDLNTEASRCTLSNRIMHAYEKYKDIDMIDLYERDSLIEHYRIYKKYDGNGMKEKVKTRYNELMTKKVK